MRRVLSFLLIGSVMFLYACGGGGGNGSSDGTSSVTSGGSNRAVLGPLSGADVKIYKLNDLITPVFTTTTTTVESTGSYADIGFFDVTLPADISDDEFLLISVSDGSDIDPEDDGAMDSAYVQNLGKIRAIVRAGDINQGIYVNAITEMSYLALRKNIKVGFYDNDTLLKEDLQLLNTLMFKESVDLDNDTDYRDIYSFNPLRQTDREKLLFSYQSMLPDQTGNTFISMIHNNESLDNLTSLMSNRYGIDPDNFTRIRSILQTGQTKSYDADGNVVTDGSIKDDGYYQAGDPRSYSRDDLTNIVTDETTGLMWQDDSNATIATKKWGVAKGYCQDITIWGYSDWRLPTIKELTTIVDYERSVPAIDPVFANVVSLDYLSSTTDSNGATDNVWLISFDDGVYHKHEYTSWVGHIRCVRGDSLPESSFSRDNTKKIVTDNTTGLMWQDDAETASVTKTWVNAINYCESLILGDYSDWRLPNINELRSIVDYNEYDPAIDTVFQNVQSDYYWSSTTDYRSYVTPYFAMNLDFSDGNDGYDYKDNTYNVRCVRGSQ